MGNYKSIYPKTSYWQRRLCLKRRIFRAIENSGFEVTIRGSWKFDDFHLTENGNITYSDIDLLSGNPQNFKPEKIVGILEKNIHRIIKMKVSIHPQDYLDQISLSDSKIKNIFEYLIYLHTRSPMYAVSIDYMKAKTMMLLMKETKSDQRFKQIKKHILCPSMMNLYRIKIGLENEIDIGKIEKMVIQYGDKISHSFFENCILQHPSLGFINYIHSKFRDCKTIDDWVKSHIEKKSLNCVY